MSINPTVFNEKLILEVFNVFIDEFNKLKELSEKDETEMLNKICPSLFKKWFYSALIDDTPLTPANIIKSLSEKYAAFTIQDNNNPKTQGWTLHSVKDTLSDSFFINDIKNYELLLDDMVVREKRSNRKSLLTANKTSCYQMNLRVTTSDRVFLIPIIEKTAFMTLYSSTSNIFMENRDFADKLVNLLDDLDEKMLNGEI